jgi:hypothetical protein
MKKITSMDDLFDLYDDDLEDIFNDVSIFKAAQEKIVEIKQDDKADGGIDIAKLYSQGCTKDF